MHLPGRGPSFLLELDLDVALLDPPPHGPMGKAMSRGRPAMRQILSALGRVQGDKTVILISGGWPMDEREEMSVHSTSSNGNTATTLPALYRFIANVAICSKDVSESRACSLAINSTRKR